MWHARCGSVACARACMGHTTQGGPAPLADRCFLMDSAHHRPHLTPCIGPAADFPQPTSRMDAARGIVSVTTASNGPTTQCPVRRRSKRKQASHTAISISNQIEARPSSSTPRHPNFACLTPKPGVPMHAPCVFLQSTRAAAVAGGGALLIVCGHTPIRPPDRSHPSPSIIPLDLSKLPRDKFDPTTPTSRWGGFGACPDSWPSNQPINYHRRPRSSSSTRPFRSQADPSPIHPQKQGGRGWYTRQRGASKAPRRRRVL